MKTITKIIYLVAVICFAVSPAANADQFPNHPKREINFTTLNNLQCAPERVKVDAVLQLHFKNEGSDVVLERANFFSFKGEGLRTKRKYVVEGNVRVNKESSRWSQGAVGGGESLIEFFVIGRPNPRGQPDPNPDMPFHFSVAYKVVYEFAEKVTGAKLFKLRVCCDPQGCCKFSNPRGPCLEDN
jgi:hypothetical protein